METAHNKGIDTLIAIDDVIQVRIIVSEFNFQSTTVIQLDPDKNGLVGKAYKSDNSDLQVRWRNLDMLDTFWWEQEAKFYQFLQDQGIEYSSDEYSDLYEWEITANGANGVLVYTGRQRG